MAQMPYGAAAARLESALADVRALPPRATVARVMHAIRRAEIHASTALAGSALTADEVDALLDRDRALGSHRFGDYVLVRAYADAARFIADSRLPPAGDPRPLLTIDELRSLNTRASTGTGARGGAWRQGNPAPALGGIVAPAAWMVDREITALLDRFGRGPRGAPIALWLAQFLGRLGRLQPFEAANGRTARLAANLMLRRLDIVPLVFERHDRLRYAAALAGSEANEPLAMTRLIGGALLRTSNVLIAAATADAAVLQPLRTVAGDAYAALAKAAQRGRLRTVVRAGRYFTTPEWIAEYRARGSAARRSYARGGPSHQDRPSS